MSQKLSSEGLGMKRRKICNYISFFRFLRITHDSSLPDSYCKTQKSNSGYSDI